MMEACLSPARVDYLNHEGIRLDLKLSVVQVQIQLIFMAAAASVIPLGLLYMRPYQFWLKDKGFHLLNHPSRVNIVPFSFERDIDF